VNSFLFDHVYPSMLGPRLGYFCYSRTRIFLLTTTRILITSALLTTGFVLVSVVFGSLWDIVRRKEKAEPDTFHVLLEILAKMEKPDAPVTLRHRVLRLLSWGNGGQYLFLLVLLGGAWYFLFATLDRHGSELRLDDPVVTRIVRDPALQVRWWARI
jgi:hypothetical protein